MRRLIVAALAVMLAVPAAAQQRPAPAAIVAALTREFGIAASRLTAFGAGMAAPTAANDNDQGRGQNRRVEIVRR